MPFLERHMPPQMRELGLGIDEWQRALELVPEVTSVQRVVKRDGSSRKSQVEDAVVAAGGGHLCPWELYVFINGSYKKDRVASGFTKNRGFLHTYFREPGARVSASTAQAVFDEACANFTRVLEHAESAQLNFLMARAAFDGTEYGPDYLCLQKGDRVAPSPHAEEGNGWSFGRSLETQEEGWYPTKFAH